MRLLISTDVQDNYEDMDDMVLQYLKAEGIEEKDLDSHIEEVGSIEDLESLALKEADYQMSLNKELAYLLIEEIDEYYYSFKLEYNQGSNFDTTIKNKEVHYALGLYNMLIATNQDAETIKIYEHRGMLLVFFDFEYSYAKVVITAFNHNRKPQRIKVDKELRLSK